MDARTHRQTDNVKTVYPPQTKFAGGRGGGGGGGIKIIIARSFSIGQLIEDDELITW